MSHTRSWPVAMFAAVVAFALAFTLAAVQPAEAASPAATVPNSAPGGYLLLGRHPDRVAQSNQGSITGEAGIQVVDGKAALWSKAYVDANEIGARFSRLHFQELDSQGQVTQQFTATAARGPTHRVAGGRTVYYRGVFRPVHPHTISFRVSVHVQARKSGTWLETLHPAAKCVASYEVERFRARILAGPLC